MGSIRKVGEGFFICFLISIVLNKYELFLRKEIFWKLKIKGTFFKFCHKNWLTTLFTNDPIIYIKISIYFENLEIKFHF